MRTRTCGAPRARVGLLMGALAALVLVPASAHAQYPAAEAIAPAIGEKYHVELSGTLWNPSLFGVISSEQFGLVGTDIDFVDDLGYKKTRFKDLRIVLRPAEKHRFRIQYTPVQYTGETTLARSIVFNGILFPVNIPLHSNFAWKVWRLGYEYDFIYKPRGFVGVLLETRFTEFTAELASPILNENEYTTAKGPLPAIGVVGRGYVLPELAINFELSGFKIPDVDPKYKANYFDWDIHGTFNATNNVGLQVGWRRMTTFLNIESDKGDLKFQGMWFGAAVRY